MNRRDFELLFRRKLDEAVQLAESKLGRSLSRELFVSETEFYRIIDLAVVEVSATRTWVCVRESGHRPAAFDATWNQPPGSGPFKQLISDQIRTSSKA